MLVLQVITQVLSAQIESLLFELTAAAAVIALAVVMNVGGGTAAAIAVVAASSEHRAWSQAKAKPQPH